MNYPRLLALLSSAAFLAACGGGGGGDAPVASEAPVVSKLTFPYRAVINTETATGSSVTLTAVGTPSTEATNGRCSGTRTFYSGAPVGGATFLGISAFSVASTTTTQWTNCTPYYDSNYLYLGRISQTGDYGVVRSELITPITVKVGDVVIRGSEDFYTDSSLATNYGYRDLSIVIEPDTADTAILNSILKIYNPLVIGSSTKDGKLNTMVQYRYRLSATGSKTMISAEYQYYDTATSKYSRLVFRR